MRLAWCVFVAHPIAMPYGLECYIPGTAWDQGLGSSLLNFLFIVPVTLDKLSAPKPTIMSPVALYIV